MGIILFSLNAVVSSSGVVPISPFWAFWTIFCTQALLDGIYNVLLSIMYLFLIEDYSQLIANSLFPIGEKKAKTRAAISSVTPFSVDFYVDLKRVRV